MWFRGGNLLNEYSTIGMSQIFTYLTIKYCVMLVSHSARSLGTKWYWGSQWERRALGTLVLVKNQLFFTLAPEDPSNGPRQTTLPEVFSWPDPQTHKDDAHNHPQLWALERYSHYQGKGTGRELFKMMKPAELRELQKEPMEVGWWGDLESVQRKLTNEKWDT